MPQYMPTDIEELEESRQSMLLSLTGQFTVVLFRFATGHWSSAIIGLAVFCIGNRARCSLQNTNLTSFVVLGFGTGILDSVDLLHSILSLGTGFFVLPLETNLLRDLTAIGLALAPISELSGARAAWDSFLKPELLLRPAGGCASVQRYQGYMPAPSPWGQMASGAPHNWHWQGPPQAHGWYNPAPRTPERKQGVAATSSFGVQGGSWGSTLYGALFGKSTADAAPQKEADDWDDNSSVSSSFCSPERSRLSWRKSRSSGDSVQGGGLGPKSSVEPVTGQCRNSEPCAQCGDTIPLDKIQDLCGTGDFADTVYCETCWQEWRS